MSKFDVSQISHRTTYGTTSFIDNWVKPNKKTLKYIWKTLTNTFNVEEGSYRSGKTLNNIISMALNLEHSPDMLHLALAPTSGSAQAIFFDGDGLGLRHWPEWQERVEMHEGKRIYFPQRIFEGKYKKHECLILIPKQGTSFPVKYIVAFGGGNAGSHKPYRGWSIGMVCATEYDLLHKNVWNEINGRTIASGRKRHFLDHNPTAPSHPIYVKEYEDFERSESFNYAHFTLDDNPSLDADQISMAKKRFDPSSVDFRRYILGERISAAGLIYTVRDYNILSEYEVNSYLSYIVVADIGITNSATVFTLNAFNRNGEMHILKEYYHKNADKKHHGVKQPTDYVEDYFMFIKECVDLMGRVPDRVYADHDMTFIREFDRLKASYELGHIAIYKAIKEEIDTRIKTGINLLYTGRLKFYMQCTKTIEAFNVAQYDPAQEEKGNYVRFDAPEKGTMIDAIDTVEYAFTHYKTELNRPKRR